MTEQSAATSWSGEVRVGIRAAAFLRRQRRSPAKRSGSCCQTCVPPVEIEGYYKQAPKRARLALPDPRLQASMNAQITHLMMSLVDDETRPGDPAVFYRAWHRQGAYITGGTRPRGEPRVSRVLSQFLAMHDFCRRIRSGGRCAWVDDLEWPTESADHIGDKVHDEWLWPHILREGPRIEEMLTAKTPLVEYTIPAARFQTSAPNQNGGVGATGTKGSSSAGWVRWPSLYVNAVSYRGLVAAGRVRRAAR